MTFLTHFIRFGALFTFPGRDKLRWQLPFSGITRLLKQVSPVPIRSKCGFIRVIGKEDFR